MRISLQMQVCASFRIFLKTLLPICLLTLSAMVPAAHAIMDLNGNGISDIWEDRFDAIGQAAGLDADGDGNTALQEATAGTDPASPVSRHAISGFTQTAGSGQVTVPSVVGKEYRLFSSADISDSTSWTAEGEWQAGTGVALVFVHAATSDVLFYRVEVRDVDSDNDGLSDWEENQLSGFNPLSNDSFNSGIPNNDFAVLQALRNEISSGSVSISVPAVDAFEKEGTPARILVTRSSPSAYPLTLFFLRKGATDPARSSAGPGDYALRDVGGTVLSDSVTVSGASGEIQVHPITDALIEVPEELNFRFPALNTTKATRVCDAANTPANNRLFVAYLSSEAGAATTASGISTIRLQGDNSNGLVNLSFSGLTTSQSAVSINVANPVSGPPMKSLRFGQVTDQSWDIRPAQFLMTDQAVLDALLNGNFYVSISTERYPSGEVRGSYGLSSGSTELQIPANPPAIALLTGDALDREIARFLSQATFGPSTAAMQELRGMVTTQGGDRIAAFSQWIDKQMNEAVVPKPSLEAYVSAADKQDFELRSNPSSPYYNAISPFTVSRDNLRRGWWLLAVHAPDQLRERMAFALSEIFVVSEVDSTLASRHKGMTAYYEMLRNSSFGTYRTLLEGVSVHPVMGHYLSHLTNQMRLLDSSGNVIVSPDENYAREIMQLFSIGLVQLHLDGSLRLGADSLPIPTYNQNDITELARVFTGWGFGVVATPTSPSGPYYTAASPSTVANTNFFKTFGSSDFRFQAQWTQPMAMFETNGKIATDPTFVRYHDNGQKQLLGLTVPAGQTGTQDLSMTLDFLSAHANTAPFIARRLIQRLVTSNPSAGYVYRVASVFQGSGGNLGAVVKAILLDYEARSHELSSSVGYGKKREPLVQFIAVARALKASSKLPLVDLEEFGYPPSETAKFPIGTTRARMSNTNSGLAQTPLNAPSVFNWYLPHYTVGGSLALAGLVAPEFQIATETTAIAHINQDYSLVYSTTGVGGSIVSDQEARGYGANADHLITDHFIYNDLVASYAAGTPYTMTSAPWIAYFGVMDENLDGKIDALDTGTFNKPAKIQEACAAALDQFDLLLCSGKLKAEYASAATPNPRSIILDMLKSLSTSLDSKNTANDQANVAYIRIRYAAYLVSTCPQALIQR